MNPFKWAKDKLASAFGNKEGNAKHGVKTDRWSGAKGLELKEVRREHPAKTEARIAAEALRLARSRQLKSRAFRRQWKWAFVSKWLEKVANKKTREFQWVWKHATYRNPLNAVRVRGKSVLRRLKNTDRLLHRKNQTIKRFGDPRPVKKAA